MQSLGLFVLEQDRHFSLLVSGQVVYLLPLMLLLPPRRLCVHLSLFVCQSVCFLFVNSVTQKVMDGFQ